LSIENLSDVPLYAARPSRHVPPKRKASAWIAVGIVHLVIVNLLIFSEGWKELVFQHGASTEITLNFRGATDRSNAPEVRMTIPQAPVGVPPELTIDPIIIPPPPITTVTPSPERGAPSDGDLLGALGRDVACIAGNYENLTTTQRSRCERIPFQGAMLPNGAIVLRQPRDFSRFEKPEPEIRLSGADGLRRQMETGGAPCPAILNVPCLTVPGR
jgi:hypothetical protein